MALVQAPTGGTLPLQHTYRPAALGLRCGRAIHFPTETFTPAQRVTALALTVVPPHELVELPLLEEEDPFVYVPTMVSAYVPGAVPLLLFGTMMLNPV